MEERSENKIGKVIQEYRKCKKITQKDLVEALSLFDESLRSVNTVTMSRWETGATSPSISKRRILLRYLMEEGAMDCPACREILVEAYWRLLEPYRGLFSRRYQYIIGNYPDFPNEEYRIEPLCEFGRPSEHLQHLLDIERVTNVAGYYQVSAERMKSWACHPGTFARVCSRNEQHLGHFVMVKISDALAEEIAYHRRSEYDIRAEDLLEKFQTGTYYVHALYGSNPRIAAILNIHAYLFMLEHYREISNLLIFSSRPDGKEVTKNYGIEIVAEGDDERYGFHWVGMMSPVEKILFSDAVLKTAF